MVQLECCHDSHDVDATEEARERHQSQSPPEQVVVNHRSIRRYVSNHINRSIASPAMYICTLDVLYLSLFARLHCKSYLLGEL